MVDPDVVAAVLGAGDVHVLLDYFSDHGVSLRDAKRATMEASDRLIAPFNGAQEQAGMDHTATLEAYTRTFHDSEAYERMNAAFNAWARTCVERMVEQERLSELVSLAFELYKRRLM